MLLLLIPLALSACNDDRADTVSGYAVNGPLDGATVEVLGPDGLLGSVTTDADGHFSVDIPVRPPYRLRVSGGTLDGMPYKGVLEAWCETTDCHATPWTTVVARLMDEHGFNAGDARAALAPTVGFDYDPFTRELLTGEPVPAQEFELNVVRAFLDYGAGVEDWVDDVVGCVIGEECRGPDSLGIPSAPGGAAPSDGAPPYEDPAQSAPPYEEPAQSAPPYEEPAQSAPPDDSSGLPGSSTVCSGTGTLDAACFERGGLEETLRRLFGDAPITDSDRIELLHPTTATTPVVGVTVASTLGGVQEIYLLLEDEEARLAFVYALSDRANAGLSMQLWVERSARLHAIVRTAEGLYRTTGFVAIAEPPALPPPEQGVSKLRVRARVGDGTARVKALVNTLTGEPSRGAGPFQIIMQHNGLLTGRLTVGPGTAPSPNTYLAFSFVGARPGDLLSLGIFSGSMGDSAQEFL